MRLKSRTRSNSGFAKASNRNRMGIAAVEMAMVAPILLIMIFMMVEASRFLTSLNATAGAAREVARIVAVTNASQSTADQLAKDIMENSLFSPTTVKVVITRKDSGVTDMKMVSVVVSIDYKDVSIIGDPFNLSVTKVRGYSSMLAAAADDDE